MGRIAARMQLALRAAVALAVSCCCQLVWVASSEAGWHLGLDAGLNRSTVTPGGQHPNPYAARTGFYAGASASVEVGRVDLRSGLIFERKGAEIPTDPESFELDYLELPLLLELRLRRGHAVRPLVLAGVEGARRVRSFSSEDLDGNGDEARHSDDLGVVVGAGLELGRVAVETRYTWGLQDLSLHHSLEGVRNRAWSFGLRLRLW